MNIDTLGKHVKKALVFQGSAKRPFLAPRGIYVIKNKLFVADTGQNRVFIWHDLPKSDFQEPDVILGQLEVEAVGRNAGNDVSASTLHYPSGIWSNGKVLIVADAWNHRVLIWKQLPTENGQAADVVLGQADFTSNLPNINGVNTEPDADTLYWPYGIFSDGKHLWIADTGNRRVLFYENIPDTNFAKADKVIGKPNFQTRDYENNQPIWPYSIKVSDKGQILVADTQFYRVLLWHNVEDAFTKAADVIIGQENFDACGQNQFGLFPSAQSLNWTYDACFYKDGILVNDTGNSRILYFDKIPEQNNPVASAVIGKRDFKTGSENKDTLLGTSSSLYWSFSICPYHNQLFIADTGNHRLIAVEMDL